MTERNFACLPAVRAQIEQSIEKMRTACQILRTNGLAETADDLMVEVRRQQVFTNTPGGWLWYLEQPSEEERARDVLS